MSDDAELIQKYSIKDGVLIPKGRYKTDKRRNNFQFSKSSGEMKTVWSFETGMKTQNIARSIWKNHKVNNSQYYIRDFSEYRKRPEEYLHKSEMERIFLEKISRVEYIAPHEFIQERHNKRLKVSNKVYKKDGVNPYSNCDPEYLKKKNPFIQNLLKVTVRYHQLRKDTPLPLVTGLIAARQIRDKEEESLKKKMKNQGQQTVYTINYY